VIPRDGLKVVKEAGSGIDTTPMQRVGGLFLTQLCDLGHRVMAPVGGNCWLRCAICSEWVVADILPLSNISLETVLVSSRRRAGRINWLVALKAEYCLYSLLWLMSYEVSDCIAGGPRNVPTTA
jgi:hypothetical protein